MVTVAQGAEKSPARDASVVVRLSMKEKGRLEDYARRKDLRVGQAARHFINEALAVVDEGDKGSAA